MKILSVNQMQKAERDCSAFNISLDMLMENAGKAVAKEVRNILGELKNHHILVMVGPGNNGGDGLVAARCLKEWGADVKVYLCGGRPGNDLNLEKVFRIEIRHHDAGSDVNLNKFAEWLAESDTVLDAVFGTGKSRSISGVYSQLLNQVQVVKKQRPGLRIISLDLPSGLDADTGNVDPATPFADNTITLGFPKIGLFNLPGAERAGNIAIVDIGISSELVSYVNIDLLTDSWVKVALPKRSLVSHKGTYGRIMAIVGSLNYSGAAYLACTGTMRVGAGLTTLAITPSLYPVMAAKMTEITYLSLSEKESNINPTESLKILYQQLPQYDTLLMGCGIGRSQAITDLIKSLLLDNQIKLPPVILDADGINIISELPAWWERFKDDAILTPHAGEMSRLLNLPIYEIQSNRIEIAKQSAVKWHKTVVLKGAYTVIASPDGRVRVSPFANPVLASAGTGDVLAGAIAGMVAQGLPLFDAAACGVYLHGLAGELVKAELGDAGTLASDLLPALPLAIRQLKEV